MIKLKATADLQQRVSLMTTLLNSADAKVNHFDSLRQRNLMIALAIFAGLSSFILRTPYDLPALFTSCALIVLMVLFLVLDHRLDRYNRGWQGTRARVVRAMRDVINDPSTDLSFPQYDAGGERFATLKGLKSTIHTLLIAGAILIFSFVLWHTLYALLVSGAIMALPYGAWRWLPRRPKE